MADNQYVQVYLPGISILGFFLFALLTLYADYKLTCWFLSDAAKEAEKKRNEEDKKKRLEEAEKSRQEQIKKRREVKQKERQKKKEEEPAKDK